MAIRTELTLRLPNSPGALAGVCRVLADEGVHILALSLEVSGHCRLVVDHAGRAAAALRGRHHAVTERDVLFLSVGTDPTVRAVVLALLRDAGVNVNYAYSAVSEGNSPALVVGVDDPQRAASAAGV